MPPAEPAAAVEKSSRATVVEDLRHVRNSLAQIAADVPALLRRVDSLQAYLEELEGGGDGGT